MVWLGCPMAPLTQILHMHMVALDWCGVLKIRQKRGGLCALAFAKIALVGITDEHLD